MKRSPTKWICLLILLLLLLLLEQSTNHQWASTRRHCQSVVAGQSTDRPVDWQTAGGSIRNCVDVAATSWCTCRALPHPLACTTPPIPRHITDHHSTLNYSNATDYLVVTTTVWLHFHSRCLAAVQFNFSSFCLITIRLRFDGRSTAYQRSLRSQWRNPLAAVTLTYLVI